MKRRTFAIAIPLALILALTAQAMELRAAESVPVLRFSGTTAICSMSYTADSSKDEVEATLTLYQGDRYVDSWSRSGTGRVFISGSCEAESGKSYKLVLTCSINGVAKLSATTTGTCP